VIIGVEYAIEIHDTTNITATPINIYGYITNTGGTISRNVSLEEGKIYSYSVRICSTGLSTCYSGAPQVTFSVVSDYDEVFGEYFSGSGQPIATSSADFYNVIPVLSSLLNKIPFGYLTQIADAINAGLEMTETATTTSIFAMDLATSGIGSTSPMGLANIVPAFEVTSETIVDTMGETNYDLLFGLLTTSIYVSGFFYIWNRGRTLIAKLR